MSEVPRIRVPGVEEDVSRCVGDVVDLVSPSPQFPWGRRCRSVHPGESVTMTTTVAVTTSTTETDRTRGNDVGRTYGSTRGSQDT